MLNRNKMKIFYLIIFLLFVPSVLYGQNSSKAFKTISISAHYIYNSNHNIFHNYWKPANGFDLSGKTEFYFGKAELGAQLSFIKAQKIDQPDYISAYFYIGWGLEQKISSRAHLYSGFLLGNCYMNFDDDNIDINLKSESELGLSLKTGLRYNIGKDLFINLSGRYQIIYTYHRIHLSYISIGLGKSFETPKWLREFLN